LAPSIARWSHVRVIAISGRATNWPSSTTGLLLDRADCEDRGLRRIEDRGEDLDAVHPEVRDRERAALEILLGELALARALDELLALRRDLDE
jgi:hypothetical protein